MELSENKQKMARGELFLAFTPELVKERKKCSGACHRYNTAGEVPRRRWVEMWRDIVGDLQPLPTQLPTQEADDALFENEPWVEPPVHIDYGTNISLGSNVYINFNSVIIDTCPVRIGSRTILGPNVSIFSGTHPLDPEIRNGTVGPEYGKDVEIGEDCWLGGNVIILPGITIGRGATIGAGSVVTKDVAPFTLVAGNPARFIRKMKTNMDPSQKVDKSKDDVLSNRVMGPENAMAEHAKKLEEGKG